MDEKMLEHRGVQKFLEKAAFNAARFSCVWFFVCLLTSFGGCSQPSIGGTIASGVSTALGF